VPFLERNSLYFLKDILIRESNLRDSFLKTRLIIVLALLFVCIVLPLVDADEASVMIWMSPTRYGLFSVCMVSAEDGWAVGDYGAIIHWNGSDWTNVTSPTNDRLESVFMVSSSDGWAVSTFGGIIHWDGGNWSHVESPTNRILLEVFMIGSSDGWAVGDSGTIIRWNGTQWIPELPLPVFALLPVILLSVIFILIRTRDKIARKNSATKNRRTGKSCFWTCDPNFDKSLCIDPVSTNPCFS
jgi:hypothetical protein